MRCRKPSTFGLPCDLAPDHDGHCIIWVPHDDDWKPDGGPESSPDHWRYEKDDDVTLSVWPRMNGSWIWEVWTEEHTCGGPTPDEQRGCGACENPDEPAEDGETWSFAQAKREAEMASRFHPRAAQRQSVDKP